MAKKTRSRKKTSSRKPARKTTARKKPAKSNYNPAMDGWITHTELASSDPGATKSWAAKVLGWSFRPSFPMPDGSEYLLYAYSDKGGGGIRVAPESRHECTVPYVQVPDVGRAFNKAIREGGEEVMAPERIMADLVIAVVRAPGGPTIGLAGPK